jgi:hypothetical protein
MKVSDAGLTIPLSNTDRTGEHGAHDLIGKLLAREAGLEKIRYESWAIVG